ncbi:MAG: ECF transporter S component [Peptococcaceae bacterium]|nr:ECF transporter S component [Peptococcaceae bacterium]
MVLLECMIPCAALFELRKPLTRELVIISVLCAIAIAGRAVFFMFPQIKPVLAVVILSGAALGCETGALVGAITMLVSNLLFAQGPWTPWQMFAMGLVGGLAGLLFCNKPWKENRPALCIFGGISAVVLYGLIMNISTAVLYNAEPNTAIILAYLISGFPMDCIHGVSTALFLWLLSKPILEKLDRIQRKYGCFYTKKVSE